MVGPVFRMIDLIGGIIVTGIGLYLLFQYGPSDVPHMCESLLWLLLGRVVYIASDVEDIKDALKKRRE